MITLSSIPAGERVRISKIESSVTSVSQLKALGIKLGDEVRIIQNNKGYLIVAKSNLRIALGRGLGHKIFVERIRRVE